jgi:glucose dehydrogenase
MVDEGLEDCPGCGARGNTPPCAGRTGPVEWTAYANDAGGSKYSSADQITRANVGTLTTAWVYRTGDYGVGRVQARDETTPIFIDGVLYLSTPFGGVRALDGATGRERWAFDADLDLARDAEGRERFWHRPDHG